MIEHVPYSILVDEASTDEVETVRSLMCVLLSRHRDYHDTKALPLMSIDEHAKFCKLNEEQTEFVKRSITLTNVTRDKLRIAGFDLPETDDEYNDAAEVSFPHRKMIYLVPQDIYYILI